MDDQRCGVCRWFNPAGRDEWVCGDCEWVSPIPLPWSLVHIGPADSDGTDCPCFERKEARDD